MRCAAARIRASIEISSSSLRSILLIAAVMSTGCRSGTSIVTSPQSSHVANLHAFARLYGELRWFHPSDAAASIDWDRFALDGVRRVINAPDVSALRAELADLITPIAPTVRLRSAGDRSPDDPAVHPASVAGLDIVAWEHKGYGDSTIASVYESKRRHRDRTVPVSGVPLASLWQAVDAGPFRGARLRLRAKIRTANHARGQIWLRVERGDATDFFDNMDDRPVVGSNWRTAEIAGNVDMDATRIVFGTFMIGAGTTWYDDFELVIQGSNGTWIPIALKDPGFESGDLTPNWSPGIGKPRLASIDGWNATLDRAQPASGKVSLRIEAATKVVKDELFDDMPRPGETVDIDLGSGLRARVPIALYSRDGRTVGDDPTVARASQARAPATAPTEFDVNAGIADVVVAWNVLEHFWPYWDVVSVDWTAELDAALEDALDDRNVADHMVTLQRLSAAAPDGHASTICNGQPVRADAPFTVDIVEGKLVVVASTDKSVMRGDIVISLDGRAAAERIAVEAALISGSPQRRLSQACRRFGVGPPGSNLTMRVRRDGKDLDLVIPRTIKRPEEVSRPAIERLDDGVYYVDLARAALPELDGIMDRLATAPGVVFDVRGRPNRNHAVLSHLLTRPDDVDNWGSIAHIVRPDHVPGSIPRWESSGWALPVLEPHITGRVAFLTGPLDISYAETVMSFVDHYHLGEIVGASTAGTNGNVAEITLPTECRTTFTGARVTKLDGSRLHLIGIQPTIPASRTIAGVTAGKDEVLEKALAFVRTGAK